MNDKHACIQIYDGEEHSPVLMLYRGGEKALNIIKKARILAEEENAIGLGSNSIFLLLVYSAMSVIKGSPMPFNGDMNRRAGQIIDLAIKPTSSLLRARVLNERNYYGTFVVRVFRGSEIDKGWQIYAADRCNKSGEPKDMELLVCRPLEGLLITHQ